MRRAGARGRVGLVAVAAVLAGVLAGCGSSTPSTAGSASLTAQRVPSARGACGARAGRPVRPRRVVWIVMENQAYSSVIGSRSAPYLNRLAAACGVATNFTAEAHPSLPNYLAMTSGSTQGVTDDNDPGSHRIGGPSIFSQLGTRWQALEESMPRACALADEARRGEEASKESD